MAKALYGHLIGPDPRLVWENDRLRARVADLEALVERLTLELAAASAPALHEELAADFGDLMPQRRPALA